jgi:hypothetical protein
VRFKIHEADYEVSAATLRQAMGENDFKAARAEGSVWSRDAPARRL